jgi:hypothetical protein
MSILFSRNFSTGSFVRPQGYTFPVGLTAFAGAASAAAYFLWVQNFIATDRCMDAGGAYDIAWQVCDKSNAESISTQFTGPVYVGTIDGQSVRLQLRDDALSYRMIAPPLRILGDLNTLRGFERDDNAVVYVLNAN